jgi:Trk-type K+ transport system membrane component
MKIAVTRLSLQDSSLEIPTSITSLRRTGFDWEDQSTKQSLCSLGLSHYILLPGNFYQVLLWGLMLIITMPVLRGRTGLILGIRQKLYHGPTSQKLISDRWVGVFNAVSAFNNSGMSLVVSQALWLIVESNTERSFKDANMVVFNKAIYMLITMAILILVGNTCFPIALRLIVWSIRNVLPDNEAWKDARYTLKFLLDHPRRCYTNLFPSEHTWFLLSSVIILNGIDCTAFAVLNVCEDYLALVWKLRI